MKRVLIVIIFGIVLNSCTSIDSQRADDPQRAEQIRLSQVEARYVLEHDTPLCPPYVESFPAKSIIPDNQPPFLLDPTSAWTISFGRGGEPIGHNMVRMNEQGTVHLLYYEGKPFLGMVRIVGKKGLLTLSHKDVSAFIEYINASTLLDMPKAYHAALYDGTHWAVEIQQGVHQKTLSFHNHFPEAIIEFANTIDRLLIMHGLLEITWETIPWDEADRYERTLWE